MTLQEIEKQAKAALKKQSTIEKNFTEKKKNLLKKIAEIDKTLSKVQDNKKSIRIEARQKIVDFAKQNF